MNDTALRVSSASNAPDSCTSVGYLTHWVTRLITRDVERELRPLNITAAQLAPLLALSEHGPMLQRDIVKISAVAQPAMVATLAKLESESLIERCSNEKDRRATIISLTSQGQELVEAARPSLQKSNSHALEILSVEEQKMLITLLYRLIAALDEKADVSQYITIDISSEP